MLSRIHTFFLGIWERNQRFKPALIGTWGVALAWFLALVFGHGSWLLQKNNFSSALLAAGVTALLSVPWRLYNERFGRVELRRDAACFLFFPAFVAFFRATSRSWPFPVRTAGAHRPAAFLPGAAPVLQ